MEKNKNKLWWKPAIKIFSEISTWIAIPIVLSLIIGKALDEHYNTKPWIFIGFALMGFLVSSFGIIKTVKKYMENIKKEEKK